MTTWAQLRAASDRRICWYLTIEGLGYGLSSGALASAISDGTGLVRFWTRRPAYVTSALLAAQPEMELIHRECLLELPDVLSERVDPQGGFPDLGEISFGALDSIDENVGGTYTTASGWLTSLLRLVASPITQLTSAVNAITTTIPIGLGGLALALTAPDNVMFIGSEAMRIVSVAGNNVTVARAHLGTDAQSHEANDLIYAFTPGIIRRVVRLYAVSYSAASISDDTLIGEYVVDGARFDGRFGAWNFTAKSISKQLSRKAPIVEDLATITYSAPSFMDFRPIPGGRNTEDWRVWTGSQADPLESFYVLNGSEVMSARSRIAMEIIPVRRALAGTEQEPLDIGTVIRRVFVADDAGAGDFRYSPNQATVRTDADWVKTSHWIDIILSIMTSSADPDDGLELVNYDASWPNYSWLPTGYGLGVPASRIDWDAWMDVRARTPDYVFPWFVYGRQSEPFSELITREFLRPLGAYLLTESGVVRIVLPRMPWSGSTTITLGTSDLLAREVGPGLLEPDADVSIVASRLAGTVQYRLGPQSVPWTFDDRAFAGLYGQRGYYAHSDGGIVIDVPSADPSRAEYLGLEAAGRIYRSRRPQIELSAAVDLDVGWQANVGDVVAVTLPGAPNLDGTRSWSGQRLEVEERELQPQDASYRTRAVGFGIALSIRKICPAAWVSSSLGNVATVLANRYTQADATGGLPVTDAAAFTVGDIVRLRYSNGSLVDAATQEITDITGNDITLDGDFGGSLTSGTVLCYADQDEVTTDQNDGWAFESLKTDPEGDLCIYGEP